MKGDISVTSIDAKGATQEVGREVSLAVMPERDVRLRLNDYYEVYRPADPDLAKQEGARCLNCGAAFCMPDSGYGEGCPIYNKIPEWNELVRLGRWEDAYHRLSQTNPFPEFTSRVCPAPCQDACILGINEQPIQIKGIERSIIDHAFAAGWVEPLAPKQRTGRHLAVVGSGPAGLSAAHELNAMGHEVTVYEQADRPGGLLRYGVPNMKLDKRVLDRRIDLMIESGVRFNNNCSIGQDIKAEQLVDAHDGVVLACGAMKARDLNMPGRDLGGIHQAVAYLTASMKSQQSGEASAIDAAGQRVVIIGAGDTGADCIATAYRQGAVSVTNLSNTPPPPPVRDDQHPWPSMKRTFRVDYSHAEGAALHGEDPRQWNISSSAFLESKNHPGQIGGLRCEDAHGVAQEISADLVLLSVGFTGHDCGPLIEALEHARDKHAGTKMGSPLPIVQAGDMSIGPSLVVHAIAQGKQAAEEISAALTVS